MLSAVRAACLMVIDAGGCAPERRGGEHSSSDGGKTRLMVHPELAYFFPHPHHWHRPPRRPVGPGSATPAARMRLSLWRLPAERDGPIRGSPPSRWKPTCAKRLFIMCPIMPDSQRTSQRSEVRKFRMNQINPQITQITGEGPETEAQRLRRFGQIFAEGGKDV